VFDSFRYLDFLSQVALMSFRQFHSHYLRYHFWLSLIHIRFKIQLLRMLREINMKQIDPVTSPQRIVVGVTIINMGVYLLFFS